MHSNRRHLFILMLFIFLVGGASRLWAADVPAVTSDPSSAEVKVSSTEIKTIPNNVLPSPSSTVDSNKKTAEDANLNAIIKDEKTKEGYVVNIKDLIKRSKAKIEKVNVKLEEQARFRRNQQREEKVREYYQKAMSLYEEGKYDEARELWDKAIKLTEHPEMKDYVGISAKRFEKQDKILDKEEQQRIKQLEAERGFSAKEVMKIYDSAVKLFQQKKLVIAKEQLESVEEMFPDFKATRSYLMVIEQEIQKEQSNIIEKKLAQQTEEAKKKKEEWRKKINLEEKERQQKSVEQADKLYNEAIRSYKIGMYQQARDIFTEVEWIVPDYKFTQQYLTKLNTEAPPEKVGVNPEDKIEFFKKQVRHERLEVEKQDDVKDEKAQLLDVANKKRLDEEAQFVYEGAVALFNLQQYTKAKQQFYAVEKICSKYKKTDDYLEKIRRWEDGESLKLNGDEIKKLYVDGMRLFEQKKWVEAKEKFERVSELYSSYKATARYLTQIDQKLQSAGLATDGKKVEAIATKLDLKSNEMKEVVKEEVKKIKNISTSEKVEKNSSVASKKSSGDDVVQKAIDDRKQKFSSEAEYKYQQGLVFYNEKKWIEAKRKFIQVEAVYSNYKDTVDYFKKIDDVLNKTNGTVAGSVTVVKNKKAWDKNQFEENIKEKLTASLTKEVEEIYNNAVSLFNNKLYALAKERFGQVEKLNPNYKKTARYLKHLESILAKDEKYQKSFSVKTSESKSSIVQTKVVAPAEILSPKIEMKNIDESSVAGVYERGMIFYKAKQYERAKNMFDEIQKVQPSYRQTNKMLYKINQLLVKQNQYIEKTTSKGGGIIAGADVVEAESSQGVELPSKTETSEYKKLSVKDLEILYDEAVALFKLKEYNLAREKFNLVELSQTNYRSALRYLDMIDLAQEQQQVQTQLVETKKGNDLVIAEEQGDVNELAQIKYDQAIALFNTRQYVQAKRLFTEVKEISPSAAKDVNKYIKKAEDEIAKEIWEIEKSKYSAKQQGVINHPSVDGYAAKSNEKMLRLKAKEQFEERLQKMQYKQFRKELDLQEQNKERIENKREKEDRQLQGKIVKDLIKTVAAPAVVKKASDEVVVSEEKENLTPEVSVPITPEVKVVPEVVASVVPEVKVVPEVVVPVAPEAVSEVVTPAAPEVKVPETNVSPKINIEVLDSFENEINDRAQEEMAEEGALVELVELLDEADLIEKRKIRSELQSELELYKEKKMLIERKQQFILAKEGNKVRKMVKKNGVVELRRWKKDVAVMYRDGLRYFQEGDYFRARVQFKAAQQVIPDYRYSQEMIRRCDEALNSLKDSEIEQPLESIIVENKVAVEPKKVFEKDKVEVPVKAVVDKVSLEKKEAVVTLEEKKPDVVIENEAQVPVIQPVVNQKELQKDAREIYKDLVFLVSQNDTELASQKVEQLDVMLDNSDLEKTFVNAMRKKIQAQSKKIQQKQDREKALLEKKVKAEAFKQSSSKESVLENLEKKIDDGDDKLAQEREQLQKLNKIDFEELKAKQLEQVRQEREEIQRVKKRMGKIEQQYGQKLGAKADSAKVCSIKKADVGAILENLGGNDKVVNGKVLDDEKADSAVVALSDDLKLNSEELNQAKELQEVNTKRDEIIDLIHKRQQEIDADRQSVQNELNLQLEKMYSRAMSLIKSNPHEALKIFAAIQEIQPAYKDTVKYLKDIQLQNSVK